MPPRPPLTTLVIHTWKEHGKPRPLSNDDTSEASARARISRSISIDAHLTTNPPPTDDPSTQYPRPIISQSSTFEDALFLSQSPLHTHTNHLSRYAMARSVSVEDGMRLATRPTPRLRLEDSLLSSPFLLTPVESEDEIDNLPSPNRPIPQISNHASLPPHSDSHMLHASHGNHRRTRSTSGMCLTPATRLGQSPIAQTVYQPGVGARNGPEGMTAVLDCDTPFGASVSIDTGLSAIARGNHVSTNE